MLIYRLTKEKYSDDPLSPIGAKQFGGRWNNKGMAAVYASDSIALAAMEILVHLGRNDILNAYVLCTLSLEEDALMTLAEDSLPANWRDDPPPTSTMDIGDEWLNSNNSLALAVPSTIIPQQSNIVINPKHAEFSNLVKTLIVEPFVFDSRLIV